MSWIRIKLPVALLIVALASYVVFLEVEASSVSDEQISASAVWDAQPADLAQISMTCKAAQGEAFNRCFVAQMPGFGASPEAVAFTQAYAEAHQGTVAFLKNFRAVDTVDLGYAVFPNRANTNQGWLLLNGAPEVIDVDDLNRLPQAEMIHDPVYVTMLQHHPKLTLFGGDRSSDVVPVTETLSDASQRFLIDYPLKDQCRACPVVGQASFSFEFDATGRLVKVRLVRVSAAAATAQK